MAKTAYCSGGVQSLTQEIDWTPSNPKNSIEFSSSPTQFTVEFTESEFIEVFSALLAGADAIYPDKAHDVVWLLWQFVEYPIP